MRIVYSLASAAPGGALNITDFYLSKNFGLNQTNNGTDITVIGSLVVPWASILTVLASGGANANVYDYTVVIKAPIATLDADVPVGLPFRTKRTYAGGLGVVKKINEWIRQDNNIWINPAATHYYFLSIRSDGQNLTAKEVKLLDDIAGIDILLTTDPEFTALQV
jgi:hypothetical protein